MITDIAEVEVKRVENGFLLEQNGRVHVVQQDGITMWGPLMEKLCELLKTADERNDDNEAKREKIFAAPRLDNDDPF